MCRLFRFLELLRLRQAGSTSVLAMRYVVSQSSYLCLFQICGSRAAMNVYTARERRYLHIHRFGRIAEHGSFGMKIWGQQAYQACLTATTSLDLASHARVDQFLISQIRSHRAWPSNRDDALVVSNVERLLPPLASAGA